MTWPLWTAFTAATVVLLLIPGPTILTVIGYSLSHGRRARWPLVAAVALGDSTALVVSLLGLGSLLSASAFWFTLVKWAGGLYLVWLGLRMLRAALTADRVPVAGPADPAGAMTSQPSPGMAAARRASSRRLFLDTYLVTALNPKGIVFFIAFLPQFLSPMAPVAAQLWILSVTFVVLATINAAGYALFASRARRWLDSPSALRRFNVAGGLLLSGAGIWALFARRPS